MGHPTGRVAASRMERRFVRVMARPGILSVSVGAALLMAACADARLRSPQVTLPIAYEARTEAVDPSLAPSSLDRWWLLFPDPQLQTLVEQALASAPDARTAAARIEEAEATRRSRLAQAFLPSGNPQASATQQHSEFSGDNAGGGFNGGGLNGGGAGGGSGFNNSGDSTSLSANWSPTWEIDLFGRIRQASRFANADLAAARFNAEATRLSLAAQVAQSLFQARALAVQLEDATETLRIAGELSRVGTIRAERGLGSGGDAARFQSDFAAAQAEVARLEAALAAAKRNLLVLLGRGTDTLDTLAIEARADRAPETPAQTPGELLARRPDVREAEARLRTAAANAQIARLALFPRFTLQPGVSLSKSSGANDSSSTIWSLGVSATAPVLDRPRLLAELRVSKAQGEQAVIAYEKAVQTAYGESANALTTLASDQTRVTRLEQAEGRARYAFDAARRGYQAGLTDITSLLDAERTWRGARTSLNNARAQALQDAVAAFKALGGGWAPPPVQTANAR